MEPPQRLGPRVCAALADLELQVFRLVQGTKAMCRTLHRDAAQLESNRQRLQCVAQELVDSDAKLGHLLGEVRAVGRTTARVLEADAGIRAARGKLVSELTANARREKQLRDLVRRVRASEADATELARKGPCGSAAANAATADGPVAAATAAAAAEAVAAGGVPLTQLLAYARRIGAATSLQPNQRPTLYPEGPQMKESILHHPERFVMKKNNKKRQASDMAGGDAAGAAGTGAKVPHMDAGDILGAAAAGGDAAASSHDLPTPVPTREFRPHAAVAAHADMGFLDDDDDDSDSDSDSD